MNLQNNLSRALLCALAAVGTFLVIDNGYVVLHVNCIELTLFGTQGTCDTACITFRLNVFALVMGRTLYQMFCSIRNQLDQVVRTCSYALTTSYTFLLVNNCYTVNNMDNVVENTTAAESQIRDTDMATEMVKYSNNNILAQAGQAMLAQANQANQGVLSLLG